MNALTDFIGWMICASIVSALFDATGAWFGRDAEWAAIVLVAMLYAWTVWRDWRNRKDIEQ